MFRAVLVTTLAAVACTPSLAHDLEPLCGTWQSVDYDGSRTEERWSRHADGLRGETRSFDPGGALLTREDMVLGVDAGVTVYHAEPTGTAPTEFREVVDPALAPAAGERVWVWENRAHDFPRRIVYRLAGDRLHATISDPDGFEAKRRGITWD